MQIEMFDAMGLSIFLGIYQEDVQHTAGLANTFDFRQRSRNVAYTEIFNLQIVVHRVMGAFTA